MKLRLSIVIPVYRGSETISPLVERLIRELGEILTQIVLVNDDSPDDSDLVCRSIVERYPDRVRYLRLGRNFGEHNAVMAGLNHADGDYFVVMDDDFQNPPEEVIRLVEHAVSYGFDVVYSRYEEKRHDRFRNFGSRLADFAATCFAGKPSGIYLSSFKCMNAWLKEQVIRYDGPFPYLDGIVLNATRSIGVVTVRHDLRTLGKSGYTFSKLFALWLRIFVNFSVVPLRISTFVGLAMSLIGAIMACLVLWEKLTFSDLPLGWASIYSAILVFSGLQMLMIGLLGEYVGRAYLTLNRMPQYTIREDLP